MANQRSKEPSRPGRAIGLLEPSAEKLGRWPIPVAHPLGQLLKTLREDRPVAAYLYLRDATEGVVRVMWAVLLHDVLFDLCRRPSGLSGLQPPQSDAATRVLGHVVKGGFSLGSAVHELCSDGAALQALAPALNDSSTTKALGAVLTQHPQVAERLRNLVGWRNADIGHGTLGEERRLATLLHGRSSPVVHLSVVLDCVGGWLEQVQARFGWPSIGALETREPRRGREGIPAPIAFRGDPSEGPFLLIERFEPDGLALRDITQGVRRTHTGGQLPIELAERLRDTTYDPAPLDLAPWDEARQAELFDARFKALAVETPLLAKLSELVDEAGPWVTVVGRAGVGKSYLLKQLAARAARGGWIVVLHRAAPGARHSAADLVASVRAQLSDQEIAPPEDARGARGWLEPDAQRAAAFWRGLVKANPDRRFLVVVDGLDEMQADADGRSLGVLPDTTDGELEKRTRVVLSFRTALGLDSVLRAALPERRRTLDVAQFFDSEDGRAALLRYLDRRHQDLSVEPAQRNQLLAQGRYTFLWVFHLARGLEVGFLQPGKRASEWPTPDRFYARYLAWLEERAAHHPGYVATLRRVLLSLALSPVPVNDRTLLWLLESGPSTDEASEFDVYKAWLRPVLADLSDFLVRGHADDADPSTRGSRADLIVAPDARQRPTDGRVRAIAHQTLSDYLSGDDAAEQYDTQKTHGEYVPLHADWVRARDEVAEKPRAACARLCSMFDRGPGVCGRHPSGSYSSVGWTCSQAEWESSGRVGVRCT